MSAYDPDIFHVDDDMGEYYGWGSARAELLPLLKSVDLVLKAQAPKADVTRQVAALIAEIEAPSSPATQATFTPLTDDESITF